MSESLEELKAIVDNAPEDTTHVSDNGVFYKLDGYTPLTWWVRGGEWIDSGVHHITRSISDIKLIIDLIEAFSDTREKYIRNIKRQYRYIKP